eukprot:jgi/Psemu1/311821/fgenesh1_kg.835_\
MITIAKKDVDDDDLGLELVEFKSGKGKFARNDIFVKAVDRGPFYDTGRLVWCGAMWCGLVWFGLVEELCIPIGFLLRVPFFSSDKNIRGLITFISFLCSKSLYSN